MPPESQDAQSAQDVEIASTPPAAVDQPTTEKTNEKTVLDYLDIPPELQGRLAPKAEEAQPEPEQTEIPEPNKKDEEPEELERDEDEEPEDEIPSAEPQAQRVDKRLKRINRLTRQKNDLERQVDHIISENLKLRKVLEEGQAKSPQPQNQNTGLKGGRLEELEAAIKSCDDMLEWCDDNPDGGVLGHGEHAIEADAATARFWRRKAETDRQEKIVEKREELWNLEQKRLQADKSAFQLWPEMFDKRNPEFQEAVAIIRQYPFLQALPEANLVLGTFLEGRKNLKEKLNGANGNGQVQKQHRDLDERVFSTPRVPIAPHTSEPPTRESKPSSSKTYNEAMSRLAKDTDGSSESLAGVFAAMEKAKRSRPSSQSPVRS